ncbi:MAG: ABC transporter ATP-binding protein/permease [Oscillospiraceae bacterium]|nr:ABC transporter ATP-binding protein/permease [Oscillospiraceae bacterium]
MKKNSPFNNSIYYLKSIVKYDRIRIPGVILTTLINAFDTWFIGVFAIKVIVDALLDSFDFQRIIWMLGIAVGYKSVKLIYDSFWSYYVRKSDVKITTGFQHIAFKKAADVDLQCYDDAEFYNNYVFSIQETASRPILFINSFFQLFQTIFTISLSGIYVIFNEPILLAFAVIPIVADSFLRTKMNKARKERTNEIIPESRKVDYVKRTSYLRENAIDIRITNIHVVLKGLYNNGIDNIIKIHNRFSNRFVGMYFIGDCLTHVNNTIVILYLVFKIVVLKSLTAGDFVAIKAAITLVSSNLGKIIERVQVFQEHSIYIERFRVFCNYKNKVSFGNDGIQLENSSSWELNLNNISFSYDGKNDVLKNINFSIHNGDRIAVVGKNGAGKSTLIKLILHLYDPTSGSIQFKNKNINEIKRDDYLALFDTVFQEHNSYAFSLVENVSLESELTDEQLLDVKSIFNILEFGDIFDDKSNYNLMLTKEFSNDGLILSGGKNQKIALARALYRNSHILILDEPSSALDAISEHKLMECMTEVAKGRTIIYISHRLSAIKNSDCICFMDSGKIVERGTHNELMALHGQYHEMYEIQADAYRS